MLGPQASAPPLANPERRKVGSQVAKALAPAGPQGVQNVFEGFRGQSAMDGVAGGFPGPLKAARGRLTVGHGEQHGGMAGPDHDHTGAGGALSEALQDE